MYVYVCTYLCVCVYAHTYAARVMSPAAKEREPTANMHCHF